MPLKSSFLGKVICFFIRSICIAVVLFAGCAMPFNLAPAKRGEIRSISVCKDIDVSVPEPLKQNPTSAAGMAGVQAGILLGPLGGAATAIGGAVMGGIAGSGADRQNRRMEAEAETNRKFNGFVTAIIADSVREDFMARLQGANLFSHVDEHGEDQGQARFLIAVENSTLFIAFDKRADVQRPVVRIHVWLVANPPFKYSWTNDSAFGRVPIVDNPSEHPIKWFTSVYAEGNKNDLPEFDLNAYDHEKDRVQRAYAVVCKKGVEEIMKQLNKFFASGP